MKNTVVDRITCPNPDHQDDTPSCCVYSDGSGYCFGCCTVFRSIAAPVELKKIVCNIEERIKYIDTLPKEAIRGLTLPFDNTGYYVVWPDRTYYKCRRWSSSTDSGKYINPSGHTQPLLVLNYKDSTESLVVVEGELNALSLVEAGIEADIVSPGSAGNFKQLLNNNLLNYEDYQTILILVDNDIPGLEACLLLSKSLNTNPGVIKRSLMDKDCNQILVEVGPNGLKEKISQMGVPARL